MDSEAPIASTELVKCCDCGCSCSLVNGFGGSWNRSVKRKFDELEDGYHLVIPGFSCPPVARVQIENECAMLRETVSSQHETIQDLYTELDEERNAASSAADEAMSMILRLQREKAEIQMEARQFKRFVEEKITHDQQELSALEDLLYKREQAIQALTCEVQTYKHRMMSYGLTETEADGEKGCYSRNQSMNGEGQFESPMYDYPPLRCKLNEIHDPLEIDNESADVEKYAIGETPQAHERFKNLEFRISQMDRSPRNNQVDEDLMGAKNIAEKVIVGHSPRRTRHSRKFSADNSGLDHPTESPWLGSNFKKTVFMPCVEDYPNTKKLENGSDVGDDMSDRIYTIDSVHHGVPHDDDYMTTPRKAFNHTDPGDTEIKKLYMRLQALEADRESMRQALLSVGTDKAQVLLLREIAQQLCKGMSAEKHMPVRKASVSGGFSCVAVLKWVVSIIFWRKKARQSKYMCGLSVNNMGLLMLLDKGPHLRPWRCLTRTQL